MKQYAPITKPDMLRGILLILLVVLPLSTPIVIAVSQSLNIFLVSAWKEALLLAVTPFAVSILIKDRGIRTRIAEQNVVQLVVTFLGLFVLWTILTWNGIESAASFAAGTRYLYAFLAALVLGMKYPLIWPTALRTVCVMAVIISAIGLAQTLLLPKDVFVGIGYDRPGVNTQGVPPAYHLIAGDENYVRAQSTLRGPNVLGAYLILPLVALACLFMRTRRKITAAAFILCVCALFLSFSRSAWIGAVTGVFLLLALRIPKDKVGRYVTWRNFLVGVVVAVPLLIFLNNNLSFQTIIFHSTPGQESVSNKGHKDAVMNGILEVLRQPLGGGVGSAGPASALEGSSRISENYFIQIGQELGWTGIILFSFLCMEIIRFYYSHRKNDTAQILLSSFIGLTITALLLHTWADEAVAITWWVMGGLGIGVILNEKRKHDARSK